jgi:hypothetical protein
MQGSEMADERLGRCHGFAVAAGGRSIGSVETPVFPGASSEPDFLIVRTTEAFPGTFRVVPAALVVAIDHERNLITLDLDGDAIGELPERLPLERH